MADESAPEPKGGGGGGSVLKKWGPLAAIVLVAQVVVAWVLIAQFKDKLGGGGHGEEKEQPLFDQKAKVEQSAGAEKESAELPYYWQPEGLKKMATNPAGTNATRFVAFDVELGLLDPNAKEGAAEGGGEGEGKGPAAPPYVAKANEGIGKIAAIVVEVMRSKTIDQLDAEALPEVQEEIRRKLNQQVFERLFPKGAGTEKEPAPEPRVAEVIFTKFVIQ